MLNFSATMGSLKAVLLLLASAAHVHAVAGVSFYGDGYIHLRTAEASVQTSLHVRFRTSSQTGLLFLAAGSRDFLLLELISGHVQVRLDLGSGQHWLRSEKDVHLGDLAWHSVELSHHLHNVTMTVDNSSFSSLRMPGPDVELRIQSAFVGGAAGLKQPDLLNVSSGFRGCVDKAVFNQHDLMSSLGPYSGYKSVHEVSLGCSSQFSATEEDAVGFSGAKAFVALSPWEVLQEGVFECEMHPSATADDGVILFTSDERAGFVAIAIRDGHVVATVVNGEGNKTELCSLTYVHSNNTWYHVRLHLLPGSVQLKVGQELIKAELNPQLRFHPRGFLFLGGLAEGAREQLGPAGTMSEGQLAAAGSFQGCLRGIRVNGRRTGLPRAAVTKDVSVGCQKSQDLDPWSVTRATEPPQAEVSTALPHHRERDINVLSLRTLEVAEGGRAPLEPRHIKVNLDFQKLDLRPSQLMFRVEGQPVHGELRLDLSPDTGATLAGERTVVLGADELERTFSMLDLWQGRVLYVHGGAEVLQDFFTFSVFSTNKKPQPVFLRGNYLHRLDINISPVNDAPVLSLPQGNLFTVVHKSKRKLTTDVLSVSDPDSGPAELIFSSLGNSSEGGHLENQEYPSRAIRTFSLSDLEERKISFVHTGVSSSRLVIRVSDGSKSSNTVVLRVLALLLEHKLVNNTGLEVNQGGASIITTSSLAVQVNVAQQAVDIQYDLTELPQYGELQQLHSGGDWRTTTSFSQSLLQEKRVRYLNTYRGLQMQNVTDRFKFKVSVDSASTDEAVFLVVVRWIHFKVTRSKMELGGRRVATVSPEDLHVVSKGVRLDESDLHFRILAAPKKGRLLLHDTSLQRNSTFCQKDITDGALRYELLHGVQDDTRDVVSFQVFSAHANWTTHDFRINIRADSPTVTVTNRGLTVPEGGSRVINKDLLFTHTGSQREVQYSITARPRHGWMRRINLSNSTSINDNIATFTNQDIAAERIMYVHDDSENKEDSFTFQILLYKHKHGSRREDGSPAQHTFNISVLLANDQRPARVVDKVFHVARDGQRLLTLEDLRYRDDDSDFEDSWLVYTRRGIPMGELVLASDTSHKLYEFTQKDLEKKKVLFVHRGVSFGRFVLFVSDGKHYVSALLEVMAQDPYLQAENNTGLMVQRGGVTTVTSANLSIFTNLDIRDPQEVTFEVFVPPKHGTLCFNDGAGATTAGPVIIFTQRDLVGGHLAYRHDGSDKLSDVFNVTARAREQSTDRRLVRGRREVHLDIGVPVKIYLESHQRPPTVITNRPVVVEEGHNASISRQQLEVFHEDSLPSEIVFVVQRPPSLGFLQKILLNERQQHHNKAGKQLHLYQSIPQQRTTTFTFTQEDLNQGKIFYHQQAAGSTNDSLLLEATNGVTKVGPVRLDIDIVPVLLPLQVTDLTLDEGSSLSLTSDVIKVNSHHFSGMNFLYQLIVPPRHGHLEHSRIPGMPITAFTHTEVEREYISYIHDGSDTQADSFTIVANQTEIRKQSLPCTVHINVTPVNDETPVVTANKGLKVWVGSVTEVTVHELSAEDSDTPEEGLEFVVTPPSNGHLSLKSAPSRHILNFTQHHIESGQLLFVHSGAPSGGFHFQVNDGVNFAPREIFSTTAQSLVLTLQTNRPLEVYPGSITPITKWHLQAVTNDVVDIRRNQSVVFTVTSPPKLGCLVRRLPDNSTQNVSMFTQSMVNHGAILYDQKKAESVGWSAADSFTFKVASPPMVLPPHAFTILISYQANEHQNSVHQRTKLLNNAGAVVPEGGRVVIDESKLDASNLLQRIPESHRKSHHIRYRLVSLPQYGTLSVRGQGLSRNQPDFSQADVSRFGITYTHDDSETLSDSFTFLAWVAPSMLSSSPSSSALSSDSSPRPSMYSASSASKSSFDEAPSRHGVTETFNITVTPVNDQPPLVRSRAPSMKVVVGERVILGPENLQVEDHDTPPEELHYLVISKPNNGYLTLGERPEPVTSFTQYDINHGRLHFTQQGEPSTGVFYFNITDGHHRPLYRLFSLEVMKPSVSMVNNTGLSLVQGRTAVVLTTNQLAAQTNGQTPASIAYTVTAHPCHGRIAINDQEVATFGHQDLQFGRVVYHMTDLSESEDSFQVMASASSPGVDYGNVTEQTVNVTVRPLIHLREPVRVPSGITVKLGKAMIDASELARISRANPVFEVLSPPKHGKLVKMTYDPSQASEVLKSFTFRDVVQGRVAIKETLSDGDGELQGNESALAPARGHAPATPLNDSFAFLLKAGNVQPAKGELHFTILPHHQMHHGPSSSKKTPAATKHVTTRTATGNVTVSAGGKGSGHGRSGPRDGIGTGSPPHILSNKNHNRTQHRTKAHGRWANHTHGGSHGGRPGGDAGAGHSNTAQPDAPVSDKHDPAAPPDPVYVEVLPRPASDPLLIILPLLACLLLIVILVVLILVFRHRREKRARLQLLQQLAAIALSSEDSPVIGQAERSVAMPSVVVTPLGPRSCPASPRRPVNPRRRSLAPGMTYWGPFEDAGADNTDGNIRHDNTERGHVTCRDVAVPAGYKTSGRSRSPTPTLKHKQYWV